MLPADFDRIDQSHLEHLVISKAPEGRHLEYKQALTVDKDGDRKEFLADVSSFANAAGGDIIFGIDEARDAQGKPTGIPASIIGIGDFTENDRVRLDSILHGGIAPKLIVRTKLVACGSRTVLVMRIPRSWTGPHMVTFQMRPQFHGRLNASRIPLDVEQIRGAFVESDSFAERLRSLRAERVARIFVGESPWRVAGAAVALHVVPYAALTRVPILDLHAAHRDQRLQPMATSGWNRHYNADGVAAIGPGDDGNSNYAQVFRNGVLEAVTGGVAAMPRSGGDPMLMPHYVEMAVMDQLPSYRDLLLGLGMTAPLAILVSVLNVRGVPMGAPVESFRLMRARQPLDRNELLLPDVVDETGREPIATMMRPVFDALWQAGDMAGSPNFDDTGYRTRR